MPRRVSVNTSVESETVLEKMPLTLVIIDRCGVLSFTYRPDRTGAAASVTLLKVAAAIAAILCEDNASPALTAAGIATLIGEPMTFQVIESVLQ